jgi:hypothetical protein
MTSANMCAQHAARDCDDIYAQHELNYQDLAARALTKAIFCVGIAETPKSHRHLGLIVP